MAILVGTMLPIRSANLMDLAAGLPRDVDRPDMRDQWVIRFLSHEHVVGDDVMEPWARDLLHRLAASGAKIALSMDQSKISDRHQVLMLSGGDAERALPVAWRVETTEGNVGFETEKRRLEAVVSRMPPAAWVTLMGDLFYGTADRIEFCQDQAWDYRLRLKGNLIVIGGMAKTTMGDCVKTGDFYLENVQLTARKT